MVPADSVYVPNLVRTANIHFRDWGLGEFCKVQSWGEGGGGKGLWMTSERAASTWGSYNRCIRKLIRAHRLTHFLPMHLYWDFTCPASHFATKAGFWTFYIQNGNESEQVKNNWRLLYMYQLFQSINGLFEGTSLVVTLRVGLKKT